MIWKSISIKVNGKKQLAKTILTYHAESRVKEAAEKRNDEKMLTDIKGKDLIPYFIWKKKYQNGQIYDKGDYEKVCSIIEEQVIQSNVCISMKLIMENYGIGQGQHQYRLID